MPNYGVTTISVPQSDSALNHGVTPATVPQTYSTGGELVAIGTIIVFLILLFAFIIPGIARYSGRLAKEAKKGYEDKKP